MKTLLAALLSSWCAAAFAAGNAPSVNSDFGCTDTGDAVSYSGSGIVCMSPMRPTKTVATLPTCNSGSKGRMYIVTDALGPVAIATVVAGGAVSIGVTCNGTVWIVQ